MARTNKGRKAQNPPKVLERRYDSVPDLVRATSGQQTAEDFEKVLAETKLIDVLTLLRNKAGLTQQDLASRLDCTQSKISKIESGLDADLRFGDIVAYTKATGHQMGIFFAPQGQTLVEQVKLHARIIRRLLHQMVELAGTDGAMTKGVARFLGEAAVNLVRFVQSAAKNLPDLPEGEQEQVRVEPPDECPADLLGEEEATEPPSDLAIASVARR